MSEVKGKVTSKHGFYVGDPCYVLADKNYHGVFGGNDYKEGQYTGKTETNEEFDFILAGTAYGDGEYEDEHGYVYGVDAGIIGVVPVELCVDEVSGKPILEDGQRGIDKLNGLGHYFPGTECSFVAEDGYFSISIDDKQSTHIFTDDLYGDDDEEEYESDIDVPYYDDDYDYPEYDEEDED